MLSKNYIWVTLAAFFFGFIILACMWLAFSWNKPLNGEVSVEVSLPVIDWDRYLELSKHVE